MGFTLTLALSQREREPEAVRAPSPLGERVGVRGGFGEGMIFSHPPRVITGKYSRGGPEAARSVDNASAWPQP